jgi:hypothetical protein
MKKKYCTEILGRGLWIITQGAEKSLVVILDTKGVENVSDIL